jgi:hypothetical protein
VPISRNHGSDLALSQQGEGGRMQSSFDSLLVALFVALSPPEHDGQAGQSTESFRRGFQQGYEGLRLRADTQGEAAECRYFVDAVARGKCIVRTNRALSGTAETIPSFPDQTIWIAPPDPGMPLKYSPNAPR